MTRPARLQLVLVLVLVLTAACARTTSARPTPLPSSTTNAQATNAQPATSAQPAAAHATEHSATTPAPLPPLTARAEPALDALLTRRGVSGAIALLDGDAATAVCNDLARCQQPLVPASTFKIPNSIIGLETGVIPDSEFVLPWNGVKHRITAWNQDHTLRTAFRDSAVWYYQELARRVGPARMREWVDRLDYGNHQIGAPIDQFWLNGPLAITALEQLEFLRKLVKERLPITPRTRAILLDISRRGELDGKSFHGKTGWSDPDGPNEIGWFVGWIDDPARPRYVAVAVIRPPKGIDLLPIRQAIAEDALRFTPE